jgi:pimeloyl-ACP methyl ester carboxylesterase
LYKLFKNTLLILAYIITSQLAYCNSDEKEEISQTIRATLQFEGVEREYFILMPKSFNPEKQYWLVVVVHGGGGNGQSFFMTNRIRNEADEQGLDAIVVAPSFSNTDFSSSRFPILGEGEFLKLVIKELRNKFNVKEKILLTGYSRGGQFSHRFALLNPEYVEACAPFSSGTWTLPNGTLLIESIGEISQPETYLLSMENSSEVSERLRDLFDPRVAGVAGLKAKEGAEKIPFLVMCGTLDPRFEIAQKFASNLKEEAYSIQTEWPQTPHGARDEYSSEFAKYSSRAVEFFLQITERK